MTLHFAEQLQDLIILLEEMGRYMLPGPYFTTVVLGGMTLMKSATEEQKKDWLTPLLSGEIRSSFAMTEPDVASSDASNIQASIVKNGDHYIINAKKWWTSGAMDPRCKIMIFMGKTDPSADKYKQQSIEPKNRTEYYDQKIAQGRTIFGHQMKLVGKISIYGGSNEIQKNIVAKASFGL